MQPAVLNFRCEMRSEILNSAVKCKERFLKNIKISKNSPPYSNLSLVMNQELNRVASNKKNQNSNVS